MEASEIAIRLIICLLRVTEPSQGCPAAPTLSFTFKHTPVFSFARCVRGWLCHLPYAFFLWHVLAEVKPLPWTLVPILKFKSPSKPFAAAPMDQCVWWSWGTWGTYTCLKLDIWRSYLLICTLASSLNCQLEKSWISASTIASFAPFYRLNSWPAKVF